MPLSDVENGGQGNLEKVRGDDSATGLTPRSCQVSTGDFLEFSSSCCYNSPTPTPCPLIVKALKSPNRLEILY